MRIKIPLYFCCFDIFYSKFLLLLRLRSRILSLSSPYEGIPIKGVIVISGVKGEREGRTQKLTPCQKWTPEKRVYGEQREWLLCRGAEDLNHSNNGLSLSLADLHTSHPPPS